MKNFFLGLSLVFISFLSQAQQRHCGQVEYLNELYKKNPELKTKHALMHAKLSEKSSLKTTKTSTSTTTVYTIPVVVHVIHNNSLGDIGGNNISDAQIQSQIDVLNLDYRRLNADANQTVAIYSGVAADIQINFCLATLDPNGNPTTGINRIYNSKGQFDLSDDVTLKGLAFWPNYQYLNLWVCDLVSPYLGYAQFPNYSTLDGIDPIMGYDFTDGVVIDYRTFGNIGTSAYPFNLGRTATHEVGHWLGLIHIWGDDFCGDDFVSDTPPQEDQSPSDACTTANSSCSGPVTQNMSQNYMDYSADRCMNLFTEGQKTRMRTAMEISPQRKALFDSPGCCAPEYKVSIPHSVDFEDGNNLADHWKTYNFDAASIYSKHWKAVSPGAYGESQYAFMIDNDSVYTSTDSLYWDVLESPYMDLSTGTHPMMDFDLAYAYKPATVETDSVVLYYDTGCKGRWKKFTTLDGASLVSSNRRVQNFVPNIDEWKKITIDLAPLQSKKYIKFRLAVYSKGINKLYIDNINFYKIQDDFKVNVYPVPAVGELNIEPIYTGYRDVRIEAYTILGAKLFERTTNNTTSYIEKVQVSNFQPGVYIIKVTSGNSKVVKRIEVR